MEDVSYLGQPVKNQEEYNSFLEELSKFYYKSNDVLKEEEDEEKVEALPPPPSQDKKGSSKDARRSKKVIEEPKKRTVMKVSTKILNEITVGLDDPLEIVIQKMASFVE